MEVLFSVIVSVSFAHLISQISTVQKEVKSLREAVLWIQVKLDRREDPIDSNQDID